jgi:hypothetical protein
MRLKIVGLCLIAMFSLAAVAASGASAAEPELFECAKAAKVGKTTPTGEFSDKNCSVPLAGGKYKLAPGIGKAKAFKGTGKVATLHTPAVGGEVTCKTNKSVGKFANNTTAEKVIATFSTCTSAGKKCTSAGAKAGSIVTNPLGGKLGYVSKSPLVVGQELIGEGGKDSADFTCEGLVIETKGGVIGEVTGNINKFSKTTENIFAVEGANLQKIKKFEGGPETVLETSINGSPLLKSGQQATVKVAGENLEIKA